MPVYRFRVTFEDHEDLVRDIEIKPSQTLLDLHRAILKSVKFDTEREALFSTCNDHWRKEEKFEPDQFASKKLVHLVEDPHQKFLFEFDTDRPWTLYIELFRIVPDTDGADYPRCVKEVGVSPPQFRIQPTDPELLEDEEDEVSETGTLTSREIYTDPDDFDASTINADETPEGEEDTSEGDEFEEGGDNFDSEFKEEEF